MLYCSGFLKYSMTNTKKINDLEPILDDKTLEAARLEVQVYPEHVGEFNIAVRLLRELGRRGLQHSLEKRKIVMLNGWLERLMQAHEEMSANW